MLDTLVFGNKLKELGFNFYSGVPCSFLKPFINYVTNECDYIMSANEGDAVATAAGAVVGGKKAVVLMQNSGLTNALSPLTSLNYTFKIPVLGFVSLRGEPGVQDEPQHELMGVVTTEMLETAKVKWQYLSQNQDDIANQLKEANDCLKNNKAFFFVVKKNTFEKVDLKPENKYFDYAKKLVKSINENKFPTRLSALEQLHSLRDKNTVFIATTGKTGRELYEIEDSENNLYMVGSMGCVSSFGLGIALSRSDKKVVSIDGDAALLMRMGNMPIIGANCPNNLLHVLLDNNSNDSTGGQATVSYNVDFVSIAKASGYKNAVYANNIDEFSNVLDLWRKNQGLTFVHLRIQPGSKENLGRPTIKPFEVKERLISFLEEDSK